MLPPRPVHVTAFQRHWPGPGRAAGAPRIAISLITVAAVVGAVAIVLDRPGFGWLLTALALAGVAVATGLSRATASAPTNQPTSATVASDQPAAPAAGDRLPAGTRGDQPAAVPAEDQLPAVPAGDRPAAATVASDQPMARTAIAADQPAPVVTAPASADRPATANETAPTVEPDAPTATEIGPVAVDRATPTETDAASGPADIHAASALAEVDPASGPTDADPVAAPTAVDPASATPSEIGSTEAGSAQTGNAEIGSTETGSTQTGNATAGNAAAGNAETSGTAASDAAVRDPARTPISLREHGERVFWGLCALALVSVGTFRAAGWLFFWCVVFALGCTAMSLAGGRTVGSLFAAVWAPVMAIFRAPAWIVRGLRSPRSNGGPHMVVATAVSVLLLIVFGGLFAGADAEFRHVLGALLPPLSGPEVAQAIFCLIVTGAVACGVAFLAAARPRFDQMQPMARRQVRRAEWVLPLTVINLLFAVFVFIQLKVFFGGDRSLAGASHAYMRGYAHHGFWELLVVSLLTLVVLLVTSRIAPRETSTDRTLLRTLLGGLAIFSIVIVLAALKRMGSYEHTYGYTRLRVVVAGVELWLGLLFVLILVAGITLRASWLPRLIAASLVLSLFAGAVANPDRYVAHQNVTRYQHTGKLSITYMRQLSADAVPAIDRLPPHLRACALRTIAKSTLATGDDWRTWNFARVAARNQLYTYVKPPAGTCKGVIR
jgi:hypothetical protein